MSDNHNHKFSPACKVHFHHVSTIADELAQDGSSFSKSYRRRILFALYLLGINCLFINASRIDQTTYKLKEKHTTWCQMWYNMDTDMYADGDTRYRIVTEYKHEAKEAMLVAVSCHYNWYSAQNNESITIVQPYSHQHVVAHWLILAHVICFNARILDQYYFSSSLFFWCFNVSCLYCCS